MSKWVGVLVVGALGIVVIAGLFLAGQAGRVESGSLGEAPAQDVHLRIDPEAGRHAISPLIYGVNFADDALTREVKLPISRWGGNATTRYNWRVDASNHASDWFFENLPNEQLNPAQLPDGSASDQFVKSTLSAGAEAIVTVPMIGWTPQSREVACGFSVAKYGPQQAVDQWQPDCGNGIDNGGREITGNDPRDTSVAIDPAWVEAWIEHLRSNFGAAQEGGVAFYNLDNEPSLWHETHRDVRPAELGYDELRDRTLAYAAAIRRADPTAMILGPVEWGWTAYFWSALDTAPGGAWWSNPLDRLAHGDVPLVEWYLQQLAQHERGHGARLLDYFDLHFYPQADGVALSPAGDAATQARRLRSTRALWDPTYHDESWIDDEVRLIPRMHDWVEDNYPGTKVAITEYNWGALDDLNGALAQAEVLGIFGREGLDLATLWDPPQPHEPGAYAFRLYLNYDREGGTFGDTSVLAESNDPDRLSIFAAERGSDGAITAVVVNKTGSAMLATLELPSSVETAQVWRYDASNLDAIAFAGTVAVDGASPIAFPAWSVTLLVAPRSGVPTAAPSATRTATPTMEPPPTHTPDDLAAFHIFLPIGYSEQR